MRAIVGVGNIAGVPREISIISPEEGRVVLNVARRFLPWVNLENVCRVVDGKRVAPVKHAASGPVTRPFEAIDGLTCSLSSAILTIAEENGCQQYSTNE